MESGVSVAFTVRAMDAGPVYLQRKMTLDMAIQAPELLQLLFDSGTDLFLSGLAHVWTGKAAEIAIDQVSIRRTVYNLSHSRKVTPETLICNCQIKLVYWF